MEVMNQNYQEEIDNVEEVTAQFRKEN